ncbi:hypothetical protein AB7M17_007316 [Bradyrhizobium sp. USDA 377]
MSITEFAGFEYRPIGMPLRQMAPVPSGSLTDSNINAANLAVVMIGQVWWDDHASHTVDTTGSSAIGWRSGSGIFANSGTTLKVGIASVDTSNGPTGRPSNSAGVISYDVVASILGNSGLVTSNAWIESVPTSGTRTIAHNELIAVCWQLTSRAGSDAVLIRSIGNAGFSNGIPSFCIYNGSSFSGQSLMPNCVIRASDGTRGYLIGASVASSSSSQSWNNTSTTKEYANVIQVPYACKAYGVVHYSNVGGDVDYVLYEDPFGTPTVRASVSVDANTVGTSSLASYPLMFTTGFGFTLSANTPYAIAMKPTTATNVSLSYLTFGNVAHHTSVPGGDNGYAVSRNTGAFAAQNSQLDRYFLGLCVGGGDTGGGGHFFGIIGG